MASSILAAGVSRLEAVMRTEIWGILPLLLAGMPMPAADAHLRFARVTLAEGRVEVEQGATGERFAAGRNVPVGEGLRVETARAAPANIESGPGPSRTMLPS